MMMIADLPKESSSPGTRILRLPERIGQPWRVLLISGDAAVMVFVNLVVFSSAPNCFAAAIVTTGILCGSFALCNLYKRSYAVVPRDEVYYAFTAVLFGALPALLLLAVIGQIDMRITALALLFCAVGTSALRVRLHLERRSVAPARASMVCVTPLAWHDRESAIYLLGKRLFDLIVGASALIVSLPVMLIAALAVAVDSGMPVLFTQERVGRNMRRFKLYKFRTMRPQAGAHWVKPGDDRVTRVGAWLRRSSIDELPQLLNVLRGDMSIVGPRPEMVAFAERFAEILTAYDQRHIVTPGITGWAQMYYARNLTPDDMQHVLPYDLFYVEHASVVLDCAILLKTFAEVLFQRAV